MKKLVVIDAGHGGGDTGAESVSGILESHMALSVANIVKSALERGGRVEALMTRDDDTFVTLGKRSEFANKEGAELFVSIHFNSSESTSAQGFELWTLRSVGDAVDLAEDMLKSHRKAFKNQTNRGIKQGNLSVLRRTNMPAVLWEGGFLSHVGEANWINDPVIREEMGEAIAKGILNYLKIKQADKKPKNPTLEERIQIIEDHLKL